MNEFFTSKGTKDEAIILLNCLLAMGYLIHGKSDYTPEKFINDHFSTYDCIGIDSDNDIVMADDDPITDEEFMLKAWLSRPKPSISIQLNPSYTATLTSTTIKVGCQEFTHEVLEELYEASRKIRNLV